MGARKAAGKVKMPATPNWKSKDWDEGKLAAFGAEIDKIRREVEAKFGAEDLKYLRKVSRDSETFKILGRVLIHFSLEPLTWGAGVLALWLSRQLNITEIGHYALHGCWDGIPEAEKFHSKRFHWDSPVEEESWRHGHNILHHQFTNIVGKDPDVNYVTLRVSEETPWAWHHLFQVPRFLGVMPAFMWFMNPFFSGVSDLLRKKGAPGYTDVLPDKSLKNVAKAVKKSSKKGVPYFLENFVLWPALAGPFWWKVLAGNILADVLRDSYTAASVYGGHFGDDLKFFPKDTKARGRGDWYKMQVEATHDFHASPLVSRLCGALDYQIEHHLFPKLPPNRLREVASQVRKVCEEFGLPYHNQSWLKTLWNATWRMAKFSVPAKGKRRAAMPMA